MKLNTDIENKIRKYFNKKRNVIAVYLYGSFARGEAKKGSDIDLAVVLKNPSYKNNKSHYPEYLSYNFELTKLVGIETEVKLLGSTSADFAHRVLTEGNLVLSNNEQARIKFEEKVFRNYFDLKPLFAEYYQSLSEIARKGELHVRYT